MRHAQEHIDTDTHLAMRSFIERLATGPEHTCAVLSAIASQSPDIALGVDHALEDKSGEMTDKDIEHVGAE